MKKLSLIALTTILGCTSGCSDSFKESFNKAYDSSFRSTFKTTFMAACTKLDSDEKKSAACSCIVEDLLANRTTEQLKDTSANEAFMKEHSFPLCIAKFQTEQIPDAGTEEPAN